METLGEYKTAKRVLREVLSRGALCWAIVQELSNLAIEVRGM